MQTPRYLGYLCAILLLSFSIPLLARPENRRVPAEEAEESAEPPKLHFLLGLGPVVSLGLDSKSFFSSIILGCSLRVSDKFNARVFLDHASANTSSIKMTQLGLGVDYYFTNSTFLLFDTAFAFGRRETKTYNSFTYSWGYTNTVESTTGEDLSGTMGTIGIGKHFWRDSSISFQTLLKYSFLLRSLDGAFPSFVGIQVRLLFR